MNKINAEIAKNIEPALLTIPQVCEYLNIKRATFYKINATGAFGLLPVRLGTCRKVLYQRAEVESWLSAKCPHRKQWQIMKGNRTMRKNNINIFGDVHAVNLQIGDRASIQGNVRTEEKKEGIFKKLLKIINVIIPFIKAFIYKILLHK